MAHIVLTTWGSHGDIDPFLGLALGLQARGHRATIATVRYYEPLVTGYGLGFRALGPDLDPTDTVTVERIMDRRRGSEFLLKNILLRTIEQSYADIDAAADGADLLVSHPVTFATPIVATRRRLPWVSTVLAPTSLFSSYDMPVLPPAPWLKSLERLGAWPGRLIIGAAKRTTARWAAPVYSLRQRLGLPAGGHPVFEGQHSPFLVLALFSRVLGAPQPDWPPHVVVTGHIFHDAPHGTTLEARLRRFLDDGPPPVVFTLGSSIVLVAGRFWRESIEAIKRLGTRAVLMAGPLQAEALQAEADASGTAGICVVDRAPHSLLFPRAAVVVQQCGIGTLAQSLRSGRPMLGVPYSHDQPDNAWRARALGMSRTCYPARYRARRVEAELRQLMDEPQFAAAAGRVAAVVRTEDGAATACDAIERTFRLAAGR